ncbi:hypothetical protein Tco_0896894 [Tanacetum coccineum]
MYTSNIQSKLERVLSDFDSHQEKRLSSLGTQLKQQQDEVFNRINTLLKVVSDKISDAPIRDIAKCPVAQISVVSHDHHENGTPPNKGIKIPSKLLSPKYQSQSSLGEQNRNSSYPKLIEEKVGEGLSGSETVIGEGESRDIERDNPDDRACEDTKEVEEEGEWMEYEEPLDLVDTRDGEMGKKSNYYPHTSLLYSMYVDPSNSGH